MGGDTKQPASKGPEMEPGAPALRFAEAARRIGDAARAAGLEVPAFRSPPRVPDALRTVRRYPLGSVVSVVLRGRAFPAVVADMVEGVLRVNRLDGPDADRARQELLEATRVPRRVASVPARVAERETQAA